jgi:3',5'-cyclic AMP phosphodiesterase CpdA
VSFVLAHFSDLHLGPLPRGAALQYFALKRLIGAVNWHTSRRKIHDSKIAALLINDVQNLKPDHVAFTGDLVNIAARDEFAIGAKWLREAGRNDWISFVPGNHDAYVPIDWVDGLGHLAPFMTSDMQVNGAVVTPQLATPFPYVRLRRNVAIIGLSSAVPQSLFSACGEGGHAQFEALRNVLTLLRERGFYRAVMIHHPPLPNLAPTHKALIDAASLQEIIADCGAELIMHGHNHRPMMQTLEGRNGRTLIVGVASGSSTGIGHHAPASWNRYEIMRAKNQWSTKVTTRVWHAKERQFYDDAISVHNN